MARKKNSNHRGPCDLCLLYKGGGFGSEYCVYYALDCNNGGRPCSYSDQNCYRPTGGPCGNGVGGPGCLPLGYHGYRKNGHAEKQLKKNGLKNKWSASSNPGLEDGVRRTNFFAYLWVNSDWIPAKMYVLRLNGRWPIYCGIQIDQITGAYAEIQDTLVDEKLCLATYQGNDYGVILY